MLVYMDLVFIKQFEIYSFDLFADMNKVMGICSKLKLVLLMYQQDSKKSRQQHRNFNYEFIFY